ncbi:alpha motif domain-containing 12 [Octopus vulgaris]|nr:alpha motif domain-containing 12 [Octopus vulgaris]
MDRTIANQPSVGDETKPEKEVEKTHRLNSDHNKEDREVETLVTSDDKVKDNSNVKKKRKPLYFWSTADVNKWLRKRCGCYCDMYENMFLDHEVTGRTLIRMNDIKLEKMGIADSNHRRELMQQILQQRLKHERVELKNANMRSSLLLPYHQNGRDGFEETKVTGLLEAPLPPY